MVSEDPLIPADRVIFETDEIYLKVCARVCVCLWCASNHTWRHNERSSDTWYEGYAR